MSGTSFILMVVDKTLFLLFDEIIVNAKLTVTNNAGETVFEESNVHAIYKVIKLNQPRGNYRLRIFTNNKKKIKKFQIT